MNSYRYRVVKKILGNGNIVDYINPELILHTEIEHNHLTIWYLEHQIVKETFPLVKLKEELKLRKELEKKNK